MLVKPHITGENIRNSDGIINTIGDRSVSTI